MLPEEPVSSCPFELQAEETGGTLCDTQLWGCFRTPKWSASWLYFWVAILHMGTLPGGSGLCKLQCFLLLFCSSMSYINFLLASWKSEKRNLHLWAWHYDGFYSTVAKQLVLDTKKKKKRERERKRIPPKLNGWSKRSSQRKVYNNKCVHYEKRALSDNQPNKEPEQ